MLLQGVQGLEQGLERPIGQGLLGQGDLVGLEGVQPAALEDLFGLVREQHGIAVERDAHFMRMGFASAGGMGQHARGRHAGTQGRAHIGLVGRQEQVGLQGPQVAPGTFAAREHAALDR